MFQQYADLTVIDTARRRLEDLVNHEIDGDGLIYESTVAPIRKVSPLSHSMRFFQALTLTIIVTATASGLIVAIGDHNVLILLGFALATFLAATSYIYSCAHMLKSGDIAADQLLKEGLGDRCGILIPLDLYRTARKTALPGETESETFARLLNAGITKSESTTA